MFLESGTPIPNPQKDLKSPKFKLQWANEIWIAILAHLEIFNVLQVYAVWGQDQTHGF